MPTMYPLYAYRVCFHRVLHRITSLWLLLHYNCLHPTLSLVFYSTNLLLLSYYIMCIPCLISLAISLLAHVCLCSRHDFQCMFMIRIYRCTCAYACTPLGIRNTTRWGVLTPLNPHVQILELEAEDSLGCWSEKHSGSVDRQQTRQKPYPFRPSCLSSEFFFCTSWASFVLFIIVYLFVFSYLRLSVM